MKRSIVWAVIGIILLLSACGFVFVWQVMMAFGRLRSAPSSSPPPIKVKVDVPGEVKVGQPFKMYILLENQAFSWHRLAFLRFSEEWPSFFDGKGSQPAPLMLTAQGWEYDLGLPPRQAVTVLWAFVPVKSGDFKGSITACLSSEECLPTEVHISIRDH